MKKFIICFSAVFLIVSVFCFCSAAETIPLELSSYLDSNFSNDSYLVVKDNYTDFYYVYIAPNGRLRITPYHYVYCKRYVTFENNNQVVDHGVNVDIPFKFSGDKSTVITTHNLSYSSVVYIYYDRIKLSLLNSLKFILPALIIFFAFRKGCNFVCSSIKGA